MIQFVRTDEGIDLYDGTVFLKELTLDQAQVVHDDLAAVLGAKPMRVWDLPVDTTQVMLDAVSALYADEKSVGGISLPEVGF